MERLSPQFQSYLFGSDYGYTWLWWNSNKRVSLSFKRRGSHSQGLCIMAAMSMVFYSTLTLSTFVLFFFFTFFQA